MPLPAPLTHQPPLWLWLLVGTFELVIRLIALGVVPKRRRASTFYRVAFAHFLMASCWRSPLSDLRILVGNGKVPAL